jgi:hypothetical protein
LWDAFVDRIIEESHFELRRLPAVHEKMTAHCKLALIHVNGPRIESLGARLPIMKVIARRCLGMERSSALGH